MLYRTSTASDLILNVISFIYLARGLLTRHDSENNRDFCQEFLALSFSYALRATRACLEIPVERQ